MTPKAWNPTRPEFSLHEEDMGAPKTSPAPRARGNPLPSAEPEWLGATTAVADRTIVPSRRLRLVKLWSATGILLVSFSVVFGVMAGPALLKKPLLSPRGAVPARAESEQSARNSSSLERSQSASPSLESPLATTMPRAGVQLVRRTSHARARTTLPAERARNKLGRSGSNGFRARNKTRLAAEELPPSPEPERNDAPVCTNAAEDGLVMGVDLRKLPRRAELVAIDVEDPYP